MFVLVVRDNPTAGQWCPLKVYACYSDDGGYKWSSSGICAEADGDESKVVELSDGRILMSIRNRKKADACSLIHLTEAIHGVPPKSIYNL